MMELYNSTVMELSKVVTQRYSTSFSLGIKTLSMELRMPIYAIYGFVRFADEIVDTFHNHDKEALFRQFEADTWKAINEKISLNPILHAYQMVVHQYRIEPELTKAFLKSMEMDLHLTNYNEDGYQEYIYGSAEVVGLMCLRVFCKGNEALFENLREPARRLGAAFQKVNFLRDLKSDFDDRGRVYFPGADFNLFDKDTKQKIELDIQADFVAALKGIMLLPPSSRKGVYLAYSYYLKLFEKIRRAKPTEVKESRIRVPDLQKLLILATVWFKGTINAL